MFYPIQALLEKVGQEVRAHQGDQGFKAPQDVQVPLEALVLLEPPATAIRTPASGTTLEVILSFSSSVSQKFPLPVKVSQFHSNLILSDTPSGSNSLIVFKRSYGWRKGSRVKSPPDSQWPYAQICSYVDECTYRAYISIIQAHIHWHTNIKNSSIQSIDR